MASQRQKIELKAEHREILGRAVSKLRKEGLLPAILYGKNQTPLPLQIPIKDFHKVFATAGESTLIYINVDDQSYSTIIHDISKDPLTDDIIHADFYKVRLDEKIKTMVPVIFEGEAPAVKDFQGIFVRNINELGIEGLPQDLPHEIKVDISGMRNIGDQVLIKDIQLDSGLSLSANPDEIIATIQAPMSEEELKAALETPASTVDEVEVIEKKKKEEELPAEETPATEAPAPNKEIKSEKQTK